MSENIDISSMIDIINRVVKFDDAEVSIAMHSDTHEPYFNVKHLCEMLEYKSHNKAIKRHVPQECIMYLSDIDKNYKLLYKNMQGSTKFVNEAGLYILILRSKQEKAEKIFRWVTFDVLPSIRKYGEYKLSENYKIKIDEHSCSY